MSGNRIKPIRQPRLRLEVLSPDDVQRIHQATLTIIETVGVRFPSARALDIWQAAGATVDRTTQVVRASGHLIEEALNHAPPVYTLAARDPGLDLLLDGQHSYLSTDGCGLETLDLDMGQRRPACKRDVELSALVADYLPQIAFYWPMVTALDYPPPVQSLHELEAAFNHTAKHVQTETVVTPRAARVAVGMAAAIVGGREELRRRPILSLMLCTVSPLSHDGGSLEAALIAAEAGLPTGFMTMASCCSTAPATLAGNLVVGNAEVISALALIQLACPGAPVFYAAAPTVMDLRSGAYTGGGLEDNLLAAATNHLADFLGKSNIVKLGGHKMKPSKIKDDLYWVGTLHPDRRVFDVIMPLDRGTTYNSYLIRAEKAAVVETVTNKPGHQEEFMANLEALVDLQDLAYVVLNHLEPDHSGALERLLSEVPQAQVVVSRSGEHFVRNLLNRDVQPLRMTDGDTLDLGGKTLRFVSAPFLHWPDTMLTYLVEDRVLFPCDFLSCHFCDERLFDDLVDDFSTHFRYYFDTIIRPYKEYVLRALDKIRDWPIEIIAPSHGPILRTDPRQYVERYAEWAALPGPQPKKALVFYASAYGNTTRMAEEVARGVAAAGVEVKIFDLEHVGPAEVLNEIEAADALLVGSPTIVGDAVKPVWDLLSSLVSVKVKGKIGAAFGSYGWSGEAVGLIEERMKGLKMKVPEPGVRAILTPTEEDLANCYELGRKIAASL